MLEKVDLTKKIDKAAYREMMNDLRNQLGKLQRQARDKQIPAVIVIEGWDAAGKGTFMNEILQSLDPRGVHVKVTGQPNEEESMRPYLWRSWIKLPERGRISIFDRSWYRRLQFERVEQKCTDIEIQHTFRDITAFENQLVADGYLIIKLFLHISKQEQEKRLKKLEQDPATAWRVTERDWKHHSQYDQYLKAIEEMIQKTDTRYAPWTIIESNNRRFAVVKILSSIIDALTERLTPEVQSVPLKQKQELTESSGLKRDMLDSSILTKVDLTKNISEKEYQKKRKEYQARIRELEHCIYQRRIPIVVAFEGWDAAGKGGSIRHLTQNMDPRGYTVIPIAGPTQEEKAHHYLWRFWREFPKAGHIAIFDRSWYGRVLVERVEGFCTTEEWRRAYQEINEMEEQWADFGAVLVKFWLHIDPEEQRKRFEERTVNPDKQWKITGEDWRNREKWLQYEEAIDEMFFRTSTTYAPWTIVEGNSKNYARIKVLQTVIEAIENHL